MTNMENADKKVEEIRAAIQQQRLIETVQKGGSPVNQLPPDPFQEYYDAKIPEHEPGRVIRALSSTTARYIGVAALTSGMVLYADMTVPRTETDQKSSAANNFDLDTIDNTLHFFPPETRWEMSNSDLEELLSAESEIISVVIKNQQLLEEGRDELVTSGDSIEVALSPSALMLGKNHTVQSIVNNPLFYQMEDGRTFAGFFDIDDGEVTDVEMYPLVFIDDEVLPDDDFMMMPVTREDFANVVISDAIPFISSDFPDEETNRDIIGFDVIKGWEIGTPYKYEPQPEGILA